MNSSTNLAFTNEELDQPFRSHHVCFGAVPSFNG